MVGLLNGLPFALVGIAKVAGYGDYAAWAWHL
jgi:hypothetical protein